MKKTTLVGPALAALALLTGCTTAPSAPATISPAASTGHALTRKSSGWASSDTATLTPGVQTYTGDGQCTANFVFTDANGNVYLGQAAHCATKGESSQTNGCEVQSLPIGITVTFREGGTPVSSGREIGTGTLAYSSWLTMQARREADRATCEYNDFALVRISRGDRRLVNPSVPHWGGPTGINLNGVNAGDTLLSYGNSSLRAGDSQLSPQTYTAAGDDSTTDGWSHAVESPTPGIPGDSGSAYLDAHGQATGVLSTLGFSIPVINNVGDLAKELRYAQEYSGIPGLRLELGTAPFRG